MSYKYDYFFILKNIWETWAAANDPDDSYVAYLTPDESHYMIAESSNNNERRTVLKDISSCIRRERAELQAFQQDNEALFKTPNIGESPPERGFPIHPTTNDHVEYEYLYDGTNATLNYNDQGDSTWTFPATTLPGGVNDVDKDGNFIRIPKDKFGDDTIPTGEDRYIYHPNVVWAHVWPIQSVQEDSGNIVVTLTIPIIVTLIIAKTLVLGSAIAQGPLDFSYGSALVFSYSEKVSPIFGSTHMVDPI